LLINFVSMNLSKEELLELEALAKKNNAVSKALDFIESFLSDPHKKFYNELCRTVEALSEEMKIIRDGKELKLTEDGVTQNTAPIITGDDKVFDRILKLLTENEKIFNGLRKAKLDIMPSEEEPEKEGSFADRRADKGNKK